MRRIISSRRRRASSSERNSSLSFGFIATGDYMDSFDHAQFHAEFEKDMNRLLRQEESTLAQLGRTMLAWSRLEDYLCRWFLMNTGLDWTLGNQLFYSGRSFNTRVDLFSSSLSRQLPPTIITLYMREVVKKCRQYAAFRNMIAHARSSGIGDEYGRSLAISIADASDFSRIATETDLMLAETRYELLCTSLHQMMHIRAWASPDEIRSSFGKHIELIRRLPSDPHSKEADPIFPRYSPPPQP
jgi:hypothetical protein